MDSYCSLTDNELASLLRKGDKPAFEEIYSRYWGPMYTHALKMLQDKEDARDVVQDLFVGLWTKGHLLTSDVNISGYLYITMRNKVLNLVVKRKIRLNYQESFARFLEEHSNETLDAITQKELMLALDAEIAMLPSKMKVIFEMRVKQHLSYKEIAEALEISDKTVKKQINNAIKIINPKLSRVIGWLLLISILSSHSV